MPRWWILPATLVCWWMPQSKARKITFLYSMWPAGDLRRALFIVCYWIQNGSPKPRPRCALLAFFFPCTSGRRLRGGRRAGLRPTTARTSRWLQIPERTSAAPQSFQPSNKFFQTTKGKATWYAYNSIRRTASGEIFKNNGMTCASNIHKLGTILKLPIQRMAKV